MRSLIVAVAALALAGCAETAPSRSYLALSDQLELANMRSRYFNDLDATELSPLRGRVDLSENFKWSKTSCEDAALDGYPSPDEQIALRHWIELRTAYYMGSEVLETRAAGSSSDTAQAAHRYADSLNETLKLSTALISDLADGKMTYCQFAHRDKALVAYAKEQTQPLRDDFYAAMAGYAPSNSALSGWAPAASANTAAPAAAAPAQNGNKTATPAPNSGHLN